MLYLFCWAVLAASLGLVGWSACSWMCLCLILYIVRGLVLLQVVPLQSGTGHHGGHTASSCGGSFVGGLTSVLMQHIWECLQLGKCWGCMFRLSCWSVALCHGCFFVMSVVGQCSVLVHVGGLCRAGGGL